MWWNKGISLNQLFFRIAGLGVFFVALVAALLLRQEQRRTTEKVRLDSISRSASMTSGYYSSLVRKLVLGDSNGVRLFLERTRVGEGLESISISSPQDLPVETLKTCKDESAVDYFYKVPSCFEEKGSFLVIHHELRSAGYSVGYLTKTIRLRTVGVFEDRWVLLSASLVLSSFVLLIAFLLIALRHYVIRPMQGIVAGLGEPTEVKYQDDQIHLLELQTLSRSLHGAIRAVKAFEEQTQRLEYEAKLGQLMAQVAHDIRSPVAALEAVFTQLFEAPVDVKKVVQEAIRRIRDIANDLSGRKLASPQDTQHAAHLLPIIEGIVSEKSLKHRNKSGVKIVYNDHLRALDLFSNVDVVEFSRALSNIVENAVEAVGNYGLVVIENWMDNSSCFISIQDNGAGIPEAIRPRLAERGVTHGKETGSGLGLYHAKQTVEECGGHLSIESGPEKGTRIVMQVPKCDTPTWFVNRISLTNINTVVVLDDDPAIHAMWDGRIRLSTKGSIISVIHFYSVKEIDHWRDMRSKGDENVLYVMDLELPGDKETGLQVIQRLNLQNSSILITGRADDADIQRKCVELGIKLVSKTIVDRVPIV